MASRLAFAVTRFAHAIARRSRQTRRAWTLVATGIIAALGVAAASVSQPSAGASKRTASPTASAESRPACFGAASRDPRDACRNPALRFSVAPRPAEAPTLPNSPCTQLDDRIPVCTFGARPHEQTGTVALVGDSHAGHWRGALETVADTHGWRGLSITHSSCPLSKAVRALPDPVRFRSCARWKREVFDWFADHPEVHTVFVAGLTGGTGVRPRRGRTPFATAVDGYADAWNALPSSVERIVVIRDTPKALSSTGACIDRAVARHEPPGSACAVPRPRALDPDPAVVAAVRLRSPRVRSVDLTRLFCGPRVCYPVIGGALVLRDTNHVTATFASTLGPALLEAVNRTLAPPRPAISSTGASAGQGIR